MDICRLIYIRVLMYSCVNLYSGTQVKYLSTTLDQVKGRITTNDFFKTQTDGRSRSPQKRKFKNLRTVILFIHSVNYHSIKIPGIKTSFGRSSCITPKSSIRPRNNSHNLSFLQFFKSHFSTKVLQSRCV